MSSASTVAAARPGLRIDARLFETLMTELARRGGGQRESGAFLLTDTARGTSDRERRVVTAVAYYDDLDPRCLTGGITFSADGYTALAALCRREHRRVVADIHTHPGDLVAQSPIDANHPMIALPGHIALIAPRYARGGIRVHDLGVHELDVGGHWRHYYGHDAAGVLHLRHPGLLSRARAWAHPIRHLQSNRNHVPSPNRGIR